MREDKLERHAKLCQLIGETIKEQPQEFEGFTWAVRPQADWCAILGVSDRTLRDLIKLPPVRTTSTHVEGRKAVLLRVGEPGKPSHRKIANDMASIFKKKTGRRPTPKDYGCLIGLAQIWPEGEQLRLFRAVLDEWVQFCIGLKIEVDWQLGQGEPGKHVYLEYPSISVIRRYPQIAMQI